VARRVWPCGNWRAFAISRTMLDALHPAHAGGAFRPQPVNVMGAWFVFLVISSFFFWISGFLSVLSFLFSVYFFCNLNNYKFKLFKNLNKFQI
jgi:hypothetical protein